ncbi:MFS transporter [Vibrio parahaemolyticus]
MNPFRISSLLWTINLSCITACTVAYIYLAHYVYISTKEILFSDIVLISPMITPVILYFLVKKLSDHPSPKQSIIGCNVGALVCAVVTLVCLEVSPLVALLGGLSIGFFDAAQRVSRTVAIKTYLSEENVKYAVPITLTAQFLSGGLAGASLGYFQEYATPMFVLAFVGSLLVMAIVCTTLLPSLSPEETAKTKQSETVSISEIFQQHPKLKYYVLNSILFVGVFQGIFNMARVTLPAEVLSLPESFVGYLQLVSSSAALIAALSFFWFNKSGKYLLLKQARALCFVSLLAFAGSLLSTNIPSSFALFFVYMLVWEFVFFKYETDVINHCPQEHIATVSAFKYCSSYVSIIFIVVFGGFLTEILGLFFASMVLLLPYLLFLGYDQLSTNKNSELTDQYS